MAYNTYTFGRPGKSFQARREAETDGLPIRTGLESTKLASIDGLVDGAVAGHEAELKDFKAVASYSWIEGDKPTVVVPGGTAVWANRRLPYAVPADSGMTYIDQNGYRMPKCPLEPLIRAVTVLQPAFDFAAVDVVTDRNNLRKLLRYVSGAKSNESFRIDAELAGDTLVLTRWEHARYEIVGGNKFRGFGHQFEVASTKSASGCQDTTGHHRIVTYNLGSLRFLVRFEVDAQLATDEGDDLVASLARLSVEANPGQTRTENFQDSELRYKRAGTLAPQSSLIELKTRSMNAAFDYADTYPQLFLSQTANLFLARHNRGTFSTMERISLTSPRLENEAARLKPGLKRMIQVLREMKAVLVTKAEGQCVAFVYEGGQLGAFLVEDASKSALPESLRKVFVKGALSVDDASKSGPSEPLRSITIQGAD